MLEGIAYPLWLSPATLLQHTYTHACTHGRMATHRNVHACQVTHTHTHVHTHRNICTLSSKQTCLLALNSICFFFFCQGAEKQRGASLMLLTAQQPVMRSLIMLWLECLRVCGLGCWHGLTDSHLPLSTMDTENPPLELKWFMRN